MISANSAYSSACPIKEIGLALFGDPLRPGDLIASRTRRQRLPKLREGGGQLLLLAALGPGDAKAFAIDAAAKMRLAYAVQPVLGPAVAQPVGAAAAAGHEHAGGAAAQRIFNERWRQHADADQAETSDIATLQRCHTCALVAAENSDRVVAL